MKLYGVGRRLPQLLQTIGEIAPSAVRVGAGTWIMFQPFNRNAARRITLLLSPDTFITYLRG
jgi:hypothetical protein